MSKPSVRVCIIGTGGVSEFQHAPGLELDPRAELVAVCDADQQLTQRRAAEWGAKYHSTDYREMCSHPDVDAVIVATPNFLHLPIVSAAIEAGKHVFCEKPLGLSSAEARDIYRLARDGGVVHMTSFTYRFAPSMRYLKHLTQSGALGTPRHFRSQRFLDLPETSWGWRQYQKTAGAGDLYDMTIHRIDFARDLLGPIRRVTGALAHFVPREENPDGSSCPPSDVDDWSCLIGEFDCGAVGLWEGTVVGKGYYRGGVGHEWAEVTGSEGTAVYRLHDPNHILLGKHKEDLEPTPVPEEYLKPAGSPRNPSQGEPSTVFRYDMMWEFISAIAESRSAEPSFYDGLCAQVVADATIEAYKKKTWIDVVDEPV